MIKLYNKSKCPSEILRPLITAAGQRIGARTNVVVKVLPPARRQPRGLAKSGCPYSWHLTRKRVKGHGKLISTDGGWITLRLPYRLWESGDPLKQAERFYRTTLHEWAHIKDFQDDSATNPKVFCGYNRRWANRPHERRAECMANTALERPLSKKAEDAILALAVWMEGQVAVL